MIKPKKGPINGIEKMATRMIRATNAPIIFSFLEYSAMTAWAKASRLFIWLCLVTVYYLQQNIG